MKASGNTSLAKSTVARFESLDSIRGIAALSVMLGHFFGNAISKHPVLEWLPTRIFYASHSAVIIFFVLSGFALFLLFDSSRKNYRAFVVSRWIRIYPTYLFSIFLALAFILFSKSHYAHQLAKNPPIDFQRILEHIILIGPIDFSIYNGVIWSLVHEMRISILSPLIYWSVTKSHYTTIIIFSSVSIALAACNFDTLFSQQFSQLVSPAGTIHYATFFVYGAAIAKERLIIAEKINRLHSKHLLAATALAITGYIYLELDSRYVGIEWLLDIPIAISSCWIIATAITKKFPEKIHQPRFLGKISFSLYLIHIPIGHLLLNISGSAEFTIPIALISTALSLLAAEIMWRLIESRSLGWSRTIRLKLAT